MLTILLILAGLAVLLPVLWLARVWWLELHPLYPVWPADGDGPQTAIRDNDDFLGIGS